MKTVENRSKSGDQEFSKRVIEFEEIKSKHRFAEQLLRLQSDLGIALSATSNLNEALKLILDAICQVEGIDCGGMYLADIKTGDLSLSHHRGLPSRFVELAAYYASDSPQARMVKKQKPIYGKYQEISKSKHDEHRSEGLKAIAVIPISHDGQVVAVLNVASHTHDEVPTDARIALESIAAQMGGVFGRLSAEAAMQDSQKNLQALFNSINDFLFVLDYEGNILHVNPAVEKRLGYSANETLSMNVVNMHPTDRREEAISIIAAMMAGEVSECLIPLMTKRGELVPVETKVTMGRWSGQDVLFGICRDISERKLAEEKLQKAHDELEHRVHIRTAELAKAIEDLQREIAVRKQTEQSLRRSEERFLEIAENIREVFWLFDLIEQKVVYVSPAYEIIWGRSVEDLYNRYDDWVDSIYKDDLQYARDSFSEIAQTGKSLTREYRIVRPNGDIRWILDNSFAIKDERGQVCRLAGIAADITARKCAEEEKKKLEAQVQQAQRLEALGTLAGGIAHDFNNLLMAIQGNASILLYDMSSSNPQYESLINIEKAVRSGAKLTSQLLGYARKGKYHVKPINLDQLIGNAIDVIGRTRKDIIFHHALTNDLYTIEAEQDQIEQVLLNLYVNAADSMPSGGKIITNTKNVSHENIHSRNYDPKPGNYVQLTVKDTGIGMGQKTLERIFDPFFTTKELGKGTGLGLASVYGIVKSHGGYIEVDSKVGHGSTFTIFLPASGRETTPRVKSSGRVIEGNGAILLVDDEDLVLEAGVKMLERLGYSVVKASSGMEAVEIYKDKKKAIDLVILDMIMPELGGGEAFDKMKRINPNIKVLLSSGYSKDGSATAILNRGCMGFIQKPFSLRKLSEKVNEVLDNK